MGSLRDFLADLVADPLAWVLLLVLLVGIAVLGAVVVEFFRSRQRRR